MKQRISPPEKVAEAARVVAETEQQRDQIALRQAHPRRLVRNPCGDPTSCTHGCYGTEEEAEHVRRTGMMPGEGHPIPDPGARGAFTPPAAPSRPDEASR